MSENITQCPMSADHCASNNQKIAELVQRIKNTESRRDYYAEKSLDLENRLENSSIYIQELENQSDDQRKTIKKHCEKIEELEKENASFKNKVRQIDSDLSFCDDKKIMLLNERQQFEKKIIYYETINKDLLSAINAKNLQIDILTKKIKELEPEQETKSNIEIDLEIALKLLAKELLKIIEK